MQAFSTKNPGENGSLLVCSLLRIQSLLHLLCRILVGNHGVQELAKLRVVMSSTLTILGELDVGLNVDCVDVLLEMLGPGFQLLLFVLFLC